MNWFDNFCECSAWTTMLWLLVICFIIWIPVTGAFIVARWCKTKVDGWREYLLNYVLM